MSKKRKVKKSGKIMGFTPQKLANMMMDEIKKNMVKSGFCTADQIAAAEIEIQKKESVNNGIETSSNPDRSSVISEQG